MWSEKEMRQRFGPAVEAVVRFFGRIPSWLLKLVGFPCWTSTIITMLSISGITTWQAIVFGIIPALIGTACGMTLMLRQGPPDSD